MQKGPYGPGSGKKEAGLIFLVLGHNSIYSLDRHLLYSLDRHLLAKYPDYVHQAGHFDIYFSISILYGLGDYPLISLRSLGVLEGYYTLSVVYTSARSGRLWQFFWYCHKAFRGPLAWHSSICNHLCCEPAFTGKEQSIARAHLVKDIYIHFGFLIKSWSNSTIENYGYPEYTKIYKCL